MKQETQYIIKSDAGYVFDPSDLEMTPDVTLSARMDLSTAQRVAAEMGRRGLDAIVEPVIVEDYSEPDLLIRLCGDGQIFIASADFVDLEESPVVWLSRIERFVMGWAIRRFDILTGAV